MAIFTDIDGQLEGLRTLLGDDVDVDVLAQRMSALGGEELMQALERAATVVRCIERISIVGAGVAARRSGRDAGHSGLAQARGHRTPAALVQDIAGVGRVEAQRHVRLGIAVLEGDESTTASAISGEGADAPSPDDRQQATAPAVPWHAPLSTALLAGEISSVQHDAILRGLGEPPTAEEGADDGADADRDARADAQIVDAWRCAAEQLIAESGARTVEELRQAARTVRDRLDPKGAARRFHERFERRSFRMWIEADGVQHGHIAFDDEGGAWVTTIRDAALRPRRGGPRFVDADERARGDDLAADARTNDQLSYDLLIDVLRAGALADAESVFGTRQAGVRVVQVIDETGAPVSQHTEDYLTPLPTAAIEQRLCESGKQQILVDRRGNPLDVGREQRLFTPRQRVALAIRDGGCSWRGCDRPASYCESHHIDEWAAAHGRTDVDRGILLCRYHHMQLHHGGWRISRDGLSEFRLHPPGGDPPITLYRRAALSYAWAGIDPPPQRFRSTG